MERLICLVIGYGCGLFQTSYIIGKLRKQDIRKMGSGNAGTTNAFRSFGAKAGALTLLGDLLKCVIAVLIARVLFANAHPEILKLLELYAAAGSILGHNFPFFMGFKGGKGVACSAGMVLALDPRVFLAVVLVFAVIYGTTKYVSLGSLSTYFSGAILLIVLIHKGVYGMEMQAWIETDIVIVLLTILAFVRHRSNIVRLIKGTESKVYLTKKKS